MTSRRQDNKLIQKKVNDFFRGQKWRKVLTFLFFLILSSGFWLLQYLQQKFELDFTIPVYYNNVPSGVVLDDSIPSEVRIKVEDKGTALLNYTFGKKYDPIEFSLKNIDQEEKTYTITKKMLEAEIYKRLLSSSRLMFYSPDVLKIHYSILQSKELPVLLNGTLYPALGYMINDSVSLEPAMVEIFGSRESLDTLTAIYTEEINIEDIDKSIKKKLKLISPKGTTLSENTVVLKVGAEEYTEKKFSLPVICVNLPSEYVVRFFPSTVEIMCNVSLNRYSELNETDFEIIADYKDLGNRTPPEVVLKIGRKPEWIKDYRIVPEKVEFLIERKSL